jgi:hypothetical protein
MIVDFLDIVIMLLAVGLAKFTGDGLIPIGIALAAARRIDFSRFTNRAYDDDYDFSEDYMEDVSMAVKVVSDDGIVEDAVSLEKSDMIIKDWADKNFTESAKFPQQHLLVGKAWERYKSETGYAITLKTFIDKLSKLGYTIREEVYVNYDVTQCTVILGIVWKPKEEPKEEVKEVSIDTPKKPRKRNDGITDIK